MGKGNNVIPVGHFHKDWQTRVKTWFNQPARKERRRRARVAKAAKVFPRPASGPLRPIVHSQSKKYNMKVRLGRGFSFEELKEAGVNHHQALSIGISYDRRRRNRTERSLKINVQRLKEYKNKLVLFPRDNKKPKAGEATKEQQANVSQHTGTLLPIAKRVSKLETVAAKDLDTKTSAFTTLKKARTDARMIGIREKRAKKKAEDAALQAKKSDS